MRLFPTNPRRRGARGSAALAVLIVALGATLVLAACQGGHTAAPTTPGKTTTSAAPPTTTTSTPAPTTSTSPTTVTTVTSPTSSTTTTTTTGTFAAVTGTYYGGTADAGNLYIRSDGASRYRYPDENACQCSTASAPIAYVDFSLTSLLVSGGGQGDYRAAGRITAESDPTTGAQLAGSVGSSVTVTIGPPGSAVVSFLLPNNVLMLPSSGG